MGKQAGPARPKEVRAEGRRLRHRPACTGRRGGRERPKAASSALTCCLDPRSPPAVPLPLGASAAAFPWAAWSRAQPGASLEKAHQPQARMRRLRARSWTSLCGQSWRLHTPSGVPVGGGGAAAGLPQRRLLRAEGEPAASCPRSGQKALGKLHCWAAAWRGA